MHRAPIVITATVAGIGAVLGFHAQTATIPLAAATSGTAASSSTAATAGSSSTVAGSSATASAKTSAATSASATTSSRTATTSALGDPMSTRYGAAQVRVTVAGGKVVKIEAVQLQNADQKSVAISGYAEPILRQSALAKQTAAVDAVSGATYTSLSYEGSLQSALDKLGFKAADGSVAGTDMTQLQ